LFDRSYKKIILEKINSKNKRRSKSKIYLKGVPPSKIAKIHKATMGDALKVLVDNMEENNTMLK
jgi:hypothetical protein